MILTEERKYTKGLAEDKGSTALFLFSLRKPAENDYRNEIHSERFLKKIFKDNDSQLQGPPAPEYDLFSKY